MRIAHITLQPYENDARVLRAIDALENEGFECPVVAPGHGFQIPRFDFVQKAKTASVFALGARFGARRARRAFFHISHYRDAVNALVEIRPDAIHAHDWDGLFVGAEAAERLQVPFIYDSHEFAAHMHSTRRLWRASYGALINALEPTTVRAASSVIVVSDGHGKAMQKQLSITSPIHVVRNISNSTALATPHTRTGADTILLHYHGALAEGRGIEIAIKSLTQVPVQFRLRLTGPWLQEAFKAEILALIDRLRLRDRIDLVAPVRHDQLVRHASTADIGLCLLPSENMHNAIALPNKVFDYLKAGIPIIASGTRELAFLEQTGAAIIMEHDSVTDFVSCLLSFNLESLQARKVAALQHAYNNEWKDDAKQLIICWSNILNAQ